MRLKKYLFTSLIAVSCQAQPIQEKGVIQNKEIKKVKEIPLPKGFVRQKTDSLTFGYFLQNLSFEKDNTVYFYDGTKKQNQAQHYKVIKLELPKKDIQQCADAIIRLRADYFFNKKQYQTIQFKSSTTTYNFANWLQENNPFKVDTVKLYHQFLETVFINCGTYHLADLLKPKHQLNTIQVGDVFIKGGSPGHGMIVVDVAYNNTTSQTIFILAQSFMPAQSMHVVVNEENEELSPWYVLDSTKNLVTPGYSFSYAHLKKW